MTFKYSYSYVSVLLMMAVCQNKYKYFSNINGKLNDYMIQTKITKTNVSGFGLDVSRELFIILGPLGGSTQV